MGSKVGAGAGGGLGKFSSGLLLVSGLSGERFVWTSRERDHLRERGVEPGTAGCRGKSTEYAGRRRGQVEVGLRNISVPQGNTNIFLPFPPEGLGVEPHGVLMF